MTSLLIVIFCQVVQQLNVGNDFLSGIIVDAKKEFSSVLVVLLFIVVVFNHFDKASVKCVAIWLSIYKECASNVCQYLRLAEVSK
jgi:hypothetical protein